MKYCKQCGKKLELNERDKKEGATEPIRDYCDRTCSARHNVEVCRQQKKGWHANGGTINFTSPKHPPRY